ncbi:hypothetical protein ApDm4_1770 [Acetobacter pomorum]|nr:hypothetical protein ApDm4_1770 [Acetobacter pomorum]
MPDSYPSIVNNLSGGIFGKKNEAFLVSMLDAIAFAGDS